MVPSSGSEESNDWLAERQRGTSTVKDRGSEHGRGRSWVPSPTESNANHYDDPGFHRLQKVMPIITAMKAAFVANYSPYPQNVMDEAMIPFKGMKCVCTQHCLYVQYCLYVPCTPTGRSTMKQYLPMRPVKRGIKIWVRVDSVTGYFCDCDIFVGRPAGGTQTEEGLGERVVLQLTECLTGKNYQIFADNYFTTTHLLDTLQSRRLYGCGTTRSTRCGFPKRC